jgi:hypothetical protein
VIPKSPEVTNPSFSTKLSMILCEGKGNSVCRSRREAKNVDDFVAVNALSFNKIQHRSK